MQERILKELSEAVKESEKDFSKEAAVEKGLKHTIDAEQRKLTELKEVLIFGFFFHNYAISVVGIFLQNLKTDTKTLEANEKQLSNQKPLYDELVKNNTSAKAAYESCQKQYEALITGMEINDEGQAETLLEQLASKFSFRKIVMCACCTTFFYSIIYDFCKTYRLFLRILL